MAFLVAHPPLLYGLAAGLFSFVIGASIGSSISKQSQVKVSWFTPVIVLSVASTLMVILLTGMSEGGRI